MLDAGCDDFVRKPYREGELFDKMSEHLDVRFVYAEEQATDDAALTPTALDALPEDWRRQVYEAANIADEDRLESLIAEIRSEHPAVAEKLEALMRDFGFDQIMQLAAPP